MYKILIIIWLFLIPFNCLFGQAGQKWMMNVLVCDSLQNPIPDVGIYVQKTISAVSQTATVWLRFIPNRARDSISATWRITNSLFAWTSGKWLTLKT